MGSCIVKKKENIFLPEMSEGNCDEKQGIVLCGEWEHCDDKQGIVLCGEWEHWGVGFSKRKRVEDTKEMRYQCLIPVVWQNCGWTISVTWQK